MSGDFEGMFGKAMTLEEASKDEGDGRMKSAEERVADVTEDVEVSGEEEDEEVVETPKVEDVKDEEEEEEVIDGEKDFEDKPEEEEDSDAEEIERIKQREADKRASRDYEGFSEEEQKVFGKMSNQAFDYVRPRLLEARSVKDFQAKVAELTTQLEGKGLPQSYLEHPDAYLLSPKFKEAQANLQGAEGLLGFYNTQMLALKEGNNYVDLVPDGKGGAAQVQKEANVQNELDLANKISQTNHDLSTARNQIQAMSGEHAARLQSQKGQYNEYFTRSFPEYADEEKSKGDKDFTQVMDVLRRTGFEHNPLSKFLAASAARLRKSEAKNAVFENEKAKKTSLSRQVKKAGPTSGKSRKGVKKRSGSDPDDIEGFLKRMAEQQA